MVCLKLIYFLVLSSLHHCSCSSEDFQSAIDGFIEAFDNVYSAESTSQATDEIGLSLDLNAGNEIQTESVDLGEGALKENVEQVQEEVIVADKYVQPGSEVKHELTDDVQELAHRAVSAISPKLKLVNVTEAFTIVTDKIQRSLSLTVTRLDSEKTASCRVELVSRYNIDEVTWHNCLDSPTDNDVIREKRGAIGGFKQVDEAEAKELADIAVQTLDSIDADDVKRVVTQVIRAQKQLVNGIMYHLTLEVAQSNCKEDDEQCSGDLNDHNICKILMQRLFSGDAPHNAQVIKSECTPISKTKNISNGVNQQRSRRHVDRSESNLIISDHSNTKKTRYYQPVGSKMRQDPNSDNIKAISDFALAEIDKITNSLNKQKIVRIVEAYSQVVAGIKYFLELELAETNCRKGVSQDVLCSTVDEQSIQSCNVVVWDNPWQKSRAVTNVECNSVQKRPKRALVGGRKTADPNEKHIQEIANYAVSQIDARSNSLNTQKLLIVKEAQTQVVAGTNYFLKLQLVETNCRKGSLAESDCSTNQDKEAQECDVVVYERPWQNYRNMTTVNCFSLSPDSKPRNRRAFVGGKQSQNENSDDIQEVARFAVEDLNKKSNSAYKQTLVEVVSAHTQIVSGVNYHLKLKIAESDCKQNTDVKSAICRSKESVPQQECDVTVWSRPWLNDRQVTKSSCKQAEDKPNVGGFKPVDPLAPDALEAAKLSLKSIDRASNSMYKHALIRIVDASVQTVSGKKYFLTIEIGESECTKHHKEENCALREENSLVDKCKVVVWDKPWLNQKEVLDVKCGLRSKRATVTVFENTVDLHHSMFDNFKRKYKKVYADEIEDRKRFRIFQANLLKIQALQDNEQGTAIYGPNMFADLTAKEFKQRYLGLKSSSIPKPSKHHMVPAKIPQVDLPIDFDWRDHNAVTPVKNQGQCGSCWAFSVTGNVEGQWFLKHGKLLSLSEQELVDCDKTDSGCNGGEMTTAYEAIEKLGGLEPEDKYPYDAQDETCKLNKSDIVVTVASSVNITTNETEIAQWLFANGPISIGLNANAMQFYMGGVSHPWKFLCSKDQLDHGVLLVGFGVHRTSIRHKLLPYWLIKNSWGPHWGEKGYYRVYRGDGTCGVNQMATSAIVN